MNRMKKFLLLNTLLIVLAITGNSQYCTPFGDQTSYGIYNRWKGYVYDNIDLTNYKGYITEGSYFNSDFDENFGGSNVYQSTYGCDVRTETFSVRFKLRKSFTNGFYKITIGGDDGYRFSIDGGNTWAIDKWIDQSYTTSSYSVLLNGTYDLVLEYFENGGDNRISFNVATTDCGVENTSIYGTDNSWNGYLYSGTNFDTYVGMVHKGSNVDASFNENFGGSDHQFATSGCNVRTENFSARYRLRKTFASSSYTFVVGGDDGYRFSIDGGNTWIINNWDYHSYTTSSKTMTLNGTYNLVLEYFEGGGDNNLSFFYQGGSVLPVTLVTFNGRETNEKAELSWEVTIDSDPAYFDIEKSTDGVNFTKINTIAGSAGSNDGNLISYSFFDGSQLSAKSQYRLKMVDMNNKVTYSKTVAINITVAGTNEIKVFPTVLSSNAFSINTNRKLENATAFLMDLTGATLISHQYGRLSQGQKVSFSTGSLQLHSGIYIVRILDNGQLAGTQKIVVR